MESLQNSQSLDSYGPSKIGSDYVRNLMFHLNLVLSWLSSRINTLGDHFHHLFNKCGAHFLDRAHSHVIWIGSNYFTLYTCVISIIYQLAWSYVTKSIYISNMINLMMEITPVENKLVQFLCMFTIPTFFMVEVHRSKK